MRTRGAGKLISSPSLRHGKDTTFDDDDDDDDDNDNDDDDDDNDNNNKIFIVLEQLS